MLPALQTGKGRTHESIYWEHEGHCAMLRNNWKIVKPSIGGTWELYDLERDRTERHNLAAAHPQIVQEMNDQWQHWADTHQVFPKGKELQRQYKQSP